MGFGFFRQPVVRSGGAAHRLAAPPQPTPFLAAESLVAPESPSPMKDAFSIDDNTRSTNSGFFVASSHGTRSRDRGTRDEWIRSLALHRLAAKASAVPTELRRCPCLAPVLGTRRRK